MSVADQPWTPEEDRRLRESREAGMPFRFIANRRMPGRSAGACKARWARLGGDQVTGPAADHEAVRRASDKLAQAIHRYFVRRAVAQISSQTTGHAA